MLNPTSHNYSRKKLKLHRQDRPISCFHGNDTVNSFLLGKMLHFYCPFRCIFISGPSWLCEAHGRCDNKTRGSSLDMLMVFRGFTQVPQFFFIVENVCLYLLRGGWSADRCDSREASRAAVINWWMAVTLSGRLDSCLFSTELYLKKVLYL